MALPASRIKAGFYPLSVEHFNPILGVIAPSVFPETQRIIDPYAGEGEFLEAAAQAWNLTAYANELELGRAIQCRRRFGVERVIQGDAAHLSTPMGAFTIAWVNPPYDIDSSEKGPAARTEYKGLMQSWGWVQKGGYVIWCVYHHHLTDHALRYISNHSTDADIWSLPGKHLGMYDQIIVIARNGTPVSSSLLLSKLKKQRDEETPILSMETSNNGNNPLYTMPPPVNVARFYFTSTVASGDNVAALMEKVGAWQNKEVQGLFQLPPRHHKVRSVTKARPGHIVYGLAGGAMDGAVIEDDERGKVIIRGKVITTTAATAIYDPMTHERIPADALADMQRRDVKAKIRVSPKTIVTLVDEQGNLTKLEGDDNIIPFIGRNRDKLKELAEEALSPIYEYDYGGVKPWLDELRLDGKHKLRNAQKHVVGATIRGLEKTKGVLLVGQMGVGKTVVGGASTIAIAAGIATKFRSDGKKKIAIIVSPPQLINKWVREVKSISPAGSLIETHKTIPKIRDFMDRVDKMPQTSAAVLIIPRDMIKLGADWSPAYTTRIVGKVPVFSESTDLAVQPKQIGFRALKVPCCAHCGSKIEMVISNEVMTATHEWLSEDKHWCTNCHQPLWKEERTSGSIDKKGFDLDSLVHKGSASIIEREIYPTNDDENPVTKKVVLIEPYAKGDRFTKPSRYRLDSYFKMMYPDRIGLLVWDEVHEAASGDTGNGSAFGRLSQVADKIIALTGTPFNGRATSLYNLMYYISPTIKHEYPKQHARRLSKYKRGLGSLVNGERVKRPQTAQVIVYEDTETSKRSLANWAQDMGVLEGEKNVTYEAGQIVGKKTGTRNGNLTSGLKEEPGISPRLVHLMLGVSIFFSLKDLGGALPKYTERLISVSSHDDIIDWAQLLADYEANQSSKRTDEKDHQDYKMRELFHNLPNVTLGQAVNGIGTFLKDYRRDQIMLGNGGFDGSLLQWSMSWATAPWREYQVTHKIGDSDNRRIKHDRIVLTIPALDANKIYAKEKALIDYIEKNLSEGKPVIVYVRNSDTRDIRPRLQSIIENNIPSAQVYLLESDGKADRREKLINDQIANGCNVLICNPELVKTGLDLLHFPSIIFYELTFNLSTLMQAAARSYRMNQRHPECEVAFLYYGDIPEEAIVRLMSKKKRAAASLLGEVGLSSLEALTSETASFEELLAQALTNKENNLDTQLLEETVGVSEIDADDLAYWAVGDDDDDTTATNIDTQQPVVINIRRARENRPVLEQKRKKAKQEGRTLFDFAPASLVVNIAEPRSAQKPWEVIDEKYEQLSQLSMFDFM